MHQPEDNNEAGLAAPEKLIAALKGSREQVPFIPPTVDEAVLRAARRQLRRPRPRKLFGFRLPAWAVAGAAICVLALLVFQLHQSTIKTGTEPAFAREDINHDGRVDILDAFALARQLKAGHATPGMLDINGDGVVDERDVTAIAAHAVQLPSKGGRS